MSTDYQAVLFDFDGVLVDSEPVHLACWMQVLEPFGIQLDWQEYCRRYIGIDDRLMIASLCKEVDPPLHYDDVWALYPSKKQLFQERMSGEGGITAGVRALVERLHGDFKLGVVTSSAQSEVEPILETAGLLRLLGTVVYGGDVTRHKPAPEPYLLAAERLGITRALVVEDSVAGIASGRAAGFDVLHIPQQCEMVDLLTRALS